MGHAGKRSKQNIATCDLNILVYEIMLVPHVRLLNAQLQLLVPMIQLWHSELVACFVSVSTIAKVPYSIQCNDDVYK